MSKTKNQSQTLIPAKGLLSGDLTKTKNIELTLDESGREIVSPMSRTVAAHLPSMGERIRRYLKSPTLQKDLYNDPSLWDPDDAEVVFGEDGPRVSVHEVRYKHGLEKAKKVKHERDEKAKHEAAEKEAARKAEWSAAVRKAVAEGTTPPPFLKEGQ